MSLKRRDFLKTGFAAGAAMATAVGTVEAKPKKPDPKKKEEIYDVVVVGAGFAGMCAALEAAEQGAKTVLLEKMGRPDGTTVYSSGWIAAVGSRFQKNHPEDNEEVFFNDMMKLSGYRSDPELVRVYAKEAGKGIDWLADHGTPFFLWENLPAPELSRCVISPGEGITGGSMLLRCLMTALKKKGVPIHYNTKAVKLLANDVMEVEGVACITPEGRKHYRAKGGVILTTGGFGANEPLAAEGITEHRHGVGVAERGGDVEEAVAVPGHRFSPLQVAVAAEQLAVADVERKPVERRAHEGHERGAVSLDEPCPFEASLFRFGERMLLGVLLDARQPLHVDGCEEPHEERVLLAHLFHRLIESPVLFELLLFAFRQLLSGGFGCGEKGVFLFTGAGGDGPLRSQKHGGRSRVYELPDAVESRLCGDA